MHKVRHLDQALLAAARRDEDLPVPDAGPGPDRPAGDAGDVGVFAYACCDPDGMMVRANATLASWLGVSESAELVERPLSSILQTETLAARWLSLTGPALEVCALRAGDRSITVRAEVRPATSGPGGVEIFMVRELGEELIARVARLEATLTLTAGTVHDVNNVLTVLAGNLFLFTESVRDDEKLLSQARRARNAAERGSTLLRELLTFNREVDFATKAISPGNHVLALQPLLERAIGADHELEVSIERKSGSVLASAAQLESVLINLVINARDAMRGRGHVQVTVGNARIDAAKAGELGVAPGRYVCLEVVDDGCGIPAAILHRVTQPLFSTKPKDHGSGLGLAMVKHFVEQAHGGLQIESREGSGTRVTIWLPRTEQLAETTANMTLPLSTLPGGDERLLLVSRDRDARVAIQQILETLGYAVVAAEQLEGGEGAFAGNDCPAVVISERSGAAVHSQQRWIASLKESNPVLKHIALLEAGSDPAVEAPDADGHLYRPVTVVELARAVREVLEEKQ